jgi:4-amino-4-deoxy-L-arabinose transferase-like glycosyltransferase
VRIATPVAVVLLLVVCAIPMVTALGARGPRHNMEALTLQSSQETWMRHHDGDGRAWLTPSRNGEPRVRKPPLVIWLNLLAWSDLDPDHTPVATLVRRARLVTVGFAMVLLLGTFALGRGLGDDRLGLYAMAIAGTTLLLQQQARLAAYDIHLAAWVTVAVAAAVAAVTGPHRGQSVVRWLAAGVALGLAWLSKGPIAVLLYAIPVAALVALAPDRRGRHAVGAIAAPLLAFAVVLPWYVHVERTYPGTLAVLRHEYGASLTNAQPIYYYPLRLLRALLPWTVWLIGGMCLPFVRLRPAARLRLWLPWVWFTAVVVIFSLSPGKAMRYVLIIVPPAALLAAGVLHHHRAIAERGDRDPEAGRLAVPHWVLLGVMGLGPLVVRLLAPVLRERELIAATAAVPAWTQAIVATVTLLAFVGLGIIASRDFRPERVLAATVGWMVMASTLFWHLDGRTRTPVEALPQIVARIDALVEGRPLRYLHRVLLDHPDDELLLHLRRVVRPLSLDELAQVGGERTPPAVISGTDDAQTAPLAAAGYRPVLEFAQGPRSRRVLWLPP